MNKEDAKSPKLTVPQIISYCTDELGITFNLMGEEAAMQFLQKNNFFFRLKLYAQTCPEQTKKGKYKGLDFGHLVELSTIDMFLRKLLFKMTVDLEHYLKVKLVNDCQTNPADDGYEVVENFLRGHESVRAYIRQFAGGNFYGANVFSRHVQSPAVWNFVEMISFVDFISFYGFYYREFRQECTYVKHFDSVRRLRNACAHNSSLISSFKQVPNFRYDMDTSFELLQGGLGIGNGVISSSMRVPVLNDFAVMLSVYTRLVSSPMVKEKTFQEMKDFFDGRMVAHKDYFESYTDVNSSYRFARCVLEYYSGK